MRLALAILLAALAMPALAARHTKRPDHPSSRTDEPKPLGTFEGWTAATHLEGGQMVCYAFTRAKNSEPKLPGRGDVVLSVAERPGGRDAVAISAGYAYPANAQVTLRVEKHELPFYTAQRSAFARSGHAAVGDFLKANEAVARGPAPHGKGSVTDTFSLRGFNAAYGEITKACPAK